MTPEEITHKQDILIAKFMGGKFVKRIHGIDYWAVPENTPNSNNASMGAFRYHNSFDWLMPVIEKIESLGYSTVIGYNAEKKFHWTAIFTGTEFQRKEIKSYEGETGEPKIRVVMQVLVKFITWYNQRKK